MTVVSLSGTERTSNLEIVVDFASLRASVQSHVGTGAIGSLHLNIDVGQVIDAQSLTLGSVELTLGLFDSECESLTVFLIALNSGGIVQVLQKGVVFLVGSQLQWVLVVGEQGVVSVRQVSQSAAL